MFARIRGMKENEAKIIYRHGRWTYRQKRSVRLNPYPLGSLEAVVWESGWYSDTEEE